jgi:hypothetical protein
VKPGLKNDDIIVFNYVNESVFFVDSPRPTALHCVSQRLGFANTFGRVPYDIFEKSIHTFQGCFVVGLPVAIVFPAERSKHQAH